MMLNKFKHLIDTTSATIYTEKEFEEKYNINLNDKAIDYPSHKFSDELKEIIRNLTDGLSYNILNEFTKELIYRQVIYDEEVLNYIQIITVIQGTTNPRILPFIDDEIWIKLIQLSKNYLNFTDLLKIDLNSLKESHPKEFNRAKSIKYLIDEKNCEINIENSDVDFISGLDKVYQQLDDKIKSLGGLTVIKILSNILPFNSEYKRYIFNRQLTTDNSKRNIDLPWGYIFNLALKHPYNTNMNQKKKVELLKDIIKLSSITINAAFDIQEYNIFEHYFLDLDNLVKHFKESVLYDSIFTISQSNIDLQKRLCYILFKEEDEFFKDALNFSLKEYLTVVKLLIQFFNENKHSFVIKVPKQLPSRLSRGKVIEILKFMSHTPNKCNENYLNPSEYTKINYFKKPLLQIDTETFFLPPIPFSAPNFFEALFEPLKDRNKNNLGNELGNRLELVIETLLKHKSIKFIRGGRYKVEGNPTECDFLIESEKSIIIIEVKKKVLRRDSKSGIAYNIFMDLSESLLNSQYQALRIEYLLKNNGQVHLKNDDISKLIKWNEKTIKRISISQYDFGSLHNKIFIKHFFNAILNGEFIIGDGDEDLIKKFEYLTDYQMKFNALFDKIKGHEDFNDFCMRTYFLSLDQLYFIINNSHDNDSFDRNLPNQFMISGEIDWFLEYDKFKK